MTAIRALALGVALETLPGSAAAVVTAPGEAAVETRIVWLQSLDDTMLVGRDLYKREPRRLMLIPRAAVPDVPRGTTVVAALPGSTTVRTWKVDSIDRMEADQARVIVVAA